MPIKVNPDGSFTCDTPEEAVKVQQLMLAKKSDPQPSAFRSVYFPPPVATVLSPSSSVSSTTITFLSSLAPFQGKTLDSDQMAKLLGTNTATAVGPKLRAVRNQLLTQGTTLESYLQPEKKPDGTTAWLVRGNSATEKSG